MKRLALVVIATFSVAVGLFGQHPNDERGFSADRVYSVHDVDTVNAFNGNLIIRVPIGPEYKVNGTLSYGLTLTYNSHCWRYMVFPGDEEALHPEPYVTSVPISSFNAGLGWRLSLGKLYNGSDPDQDLPAEYSDSWVYQTSDGANHKFYDGLQSGTVGNPSTAATQYTRDGSYIRLSTVDSSTMHIELPDGTVHTFSQLSDQWQPSTTSNKWYLSKIQDPFGNYVSIVYSTTSSYKEIWTISDVARTTTVYFKTPPTTDFNLKLDHVDMQAVGGATLSYSFTIPSVTMLYGNGDNTGRTPPSISVLTAITPTLGKGYSFTTPDGTPDGLPAYDTSLTSITPGVLTRLVLPTLGAVGWSYDLRRFEPGSLQSPVRSPAIEHPAYVKERKTYDANGSELATWTYGMHFSNPQYCTVWCQARDGQLYQCQSGRSRQLTTWVTEPTVSDSTSLRKTTISYFSNYEFIWDPKGDTCDTTPQGWVHAEHGLPFTRYASNGTRFLSSEVRSAFDDSVLVGWDGTGQMPGSGTTRTSYVSYRLDADAGTDTIGFDHNSSLSSTATYYNDDPNCGSGTNPPCYTAANYLGFDNFGHYLQTSTEGNLPGSGNFRTTFTNYNPTHTATSWLLNTSTERCTADEGGVRSAVLSSCNDLPSALITKTQYDIHGALTGRRTLLNPAGTGTLDPTDLLALLTYDSKGSLTSEKYYGGDTQAIGTDPFTPPMGTFPKYAITHTPVYTPTTAHPTAGALVGDLATYDNTTVTASDETYDPWTGLVTSTRDVAGLTTLYGYDVLGRVASFQPPGVTQTIYTYPDATLAGSVFTSAKVSAVTDASGSGLGKISKEYQYDPFGRLWRQKSLLDDDTWNITQTDFDVLGRKTAVSQPERLTVSEASFAPAHKTSYTAYDAFGRATSVQLPDTSTTTFTFTGVRSVVRTVNVATSASGNTATPTTEIHDAVGRLYMLTEKSGATSLAAPVGSDTTTTYTYDSGDHLLTVDTSGSTQHRAFTYDNRGFLTKEQHPELGQTGNEFVYYSGYDARGHVTGKRIGAANGLLDLRFVYDPAERLTNVFDTGDSLLPLKQYAFLVPADGSTYGTGRLKNAIRINHPPGLTTDVAVTETYTYTSPTGRPSSRDTLVENVNGSVRTTLQSFTQNFTYDSLGATSQIDYPICTSTYACSGLSLTGPAFTHKNGFLTGVATYAPAITYNPDGSLFEIKHNAAGSIKDTYTPDSSGMSRPGVISFTGLTVPSCSFTATLSGGGTITAGTNQTAPVTVSFSSGSTGPWTVTLSDGVTQSTQSISQNPYTWNVAPTSTRTYTVTNVTDATSCSGTSIGSALVTVQACNVVASVSGSATIVSGQSATITATLTGTLPWSITWSDTFSQSSSTSYTLQRPVNPNLTTTYTVTSVSAGSPSCIGTSNGSATVTVDRVPTGLIATSAYGPTVLMVQVKWNPVPGANWYQVERATRLSLQDWQPFPLGRVSSSTTVLFDPFHPQSPTTYLYRVRSGITINNVEYPSDPSNIDYATVGTTLFTDDPVATGGPIKGVYIGEIEQAIDAVRYAAGLPPAWSSYGAATGPILATYFTTPRQKLDEAAILLIGHGVSYTGAVPASSGGIFWYQLQQIRDGVR